MGRGKAGEEPLNPRGSTGWLCPEWPVAAPKRLGTESLEETGVGIRGPRAAGTWGPRPAADVRAPARPRGAAAGAGGGGALSAGPGLFSPGPG